MLPPLPWDRLPAAFTELPRRGLLGNPRAAVREHANHCAVARATTTTMITLEKEMQKSITCPRPPCTTAKTSLSLTFYLQNGVFYQWSRGNSSP